MPPCSWMASLPMCRLGAADLQPGAVGGLDDVAAGLLHHRRPQREAAGQLQRHVHVRGPEGQRLELVEGDPELLAGLEVLGRRPQRGVHGAEGLVAVGDPGDGERPLDLGRPVAAGAEGHGRACRRTGRWPRGCRRACGSRCGSARRRPPARGTARCRRRRPRETTSRSARAPLGTGSLTPVSVQPSPLCGGRDARRRSGSSGCRARRARRRRSSSPRRCPRGSRPSARRCRRRRRGRRPARPSR